MRYEWMPSLTATHAVSDAAIGLALVAISLTLLSAARRQRSRSLARLLLAGGLFALAGGATHLLELATPPRPGDWLSAGVKALTAVASVVAAILLPAAIARALARPEPGALVGALLDSAPDAVVVVDAAGRLELVGARAARLVGRERRELVGEPLSVLVPDAERLRQLRRSHGSVEVTVRRADGDDVPLEARVIRVAGEERALIVLRDDTERQRDESERADRRRADGARAQAEETGQRAAFLAEASRVLAGSLDHDATLKSMARVAVPYLADYVVVDVLDSDRRLHRLGAVHARPELEAPLAEPRPVVVEPGLDSAVASVLERGEPTLIREIDADWLAARPRDAERLGAPVLHPTSLMLVPLRARGRTLGVVTFALTHAHRRYALADLAIAEDLAQRAALAADNARLYREAQDASRAKDEFLAVLSHELRTPLTPVLGWVRMLRTGSLKPEAVGRALEAVERNTRLQMQLVEDLLDVSRIITGKFHLDLRPVGLGDVLAAAAEAVATAAAQKSITLTQAVAPDVPTVAADAHRLLQVLANLLSNAVKFTPEGGRVTATVAAAGAEVRIAVADTGEGLLPEVAPHIFDRFRQADSTITRHYGGLGLGLAIVRHIVELHGGRVEATSEGPGLGTTVTVLLPVGGPAALPARPAPGAHAEGADALRGMLRDLRVLLVDDERDARDLLTTMLETAEATVTAVDDTAGALATLAQRPVDVLVSDLAMPARDGYELMREARARGLVDGVVAVALSAQARPEDRARALAAGFHAHVTKPVDPEALATTIRTLLGRPTARS